MSGEESQTPEEMLLWAIFGKPQPDVDHDSALADPGQGDREHGTGGGDE